MKYAIGCLILAVNPYRASLSEEEDRFGRVAASQNSQNLTARSVVSGESYLAVRYTLSGGRFGDNLLSYLHAKWFAIERQIPLLYSPFPYSSELLLDEREMRLDELEGPPGGWVFEAAYFPEFSWEQARHPYTTFPVDWQNPIFRKSALEMIASKKHLTTILPPEGLPSVAIHIREGGGLDPEGFSLRDPPKCPPLSYYIESLNRILLLIPHQKIYCRLFTDAMTPDLLADELFHGASDPSRIVLDYRKENNSPHENVLEDFFSLFQFDILIRPASNFSLIPSLLHDFAIVCSPLPKGESIDIQIDIKQELLADL